MSHLIAHHFKHAPREVIVFAFGFLNTQNIDVVLSNQSSTRSARARSEFTFQVANFMFSSLPGCLAHGRRCGQLTTAAKPLWVTAAQLAR